MKIKKNNAYRKKSIKCKREGITLKEARKAILKQYPFASKKKVYDISYNVYVREEKKKLTKANEKRTIEKIARDNTPLKQFFILDSNFKNIDKNMAYEQITFLANIWEDFRQFILNKCDMK